MRAQVTGLVAAASRQGRPAYVLVTNKAEGSAPLTIRALAEATAAALAGGGSSSAQTRPGGLQG